MNWLQFLSGAVTMGFAMASLFFLRFWSTARDSLFLSFAISFLLLGIGQAMLALSQTIAEDRSWIYLIRLTAFGLIFVAIVQKNAQER